MSITPLDILLVEDNLADIELFMFAHDMNGSIATIEVARDGVEAVEYFFGAGPGSEGAGKALPKLVLLDLNMPRLNGFEVLQRLRANERTRNLPVVIFSASGQASDEREAHRLGANAYVRKPTGFDVLCATLAQLERDWLRPDAAPSG